MATSLIREDLDGLKHDLRTLRDELQLKIHLANMDLKSEWSRLEPQVERSWRDVEHVSVEAARDLKQRLTEMLARLNKQELH